MDKSAVSLFDTDMLIHRLSMDADVADGAEETWRELRPAGLASFSRVEFKGSYIQDLILLRRKVADSDGLREAFARTQNTGGRKAALMLAQLVNLIGDDEVRMLPWRTLRGVLAASLDHQIVSVWADLETLPDLAIDELACTRASEAPKSGIGGWSASIPRCVKGNTRCRVVKFFEKHRPALEGLVAYLKEHPAEESSQLKRASEIVQRTISEGAYPWEGTTCRGIGDLLIGLQAIGTSQFVSSNRAEHQDLSLALGYTFREFDVAAIRKK